MPRDLSDTPFSESRLVIWALSIIALIGVIGIITLALMERTIPPPLTATTSTCVGGLLMSRNQRKGGADGP